MSEEIQPQADVAAPPPPPPVDAGTEDAPAAETATAAGMFPVRSMPGMVPSHYNVYSPTGECVTVEASTAAEAFRLSGIADPKRIVRQIIGRQTLLDRQSLLK